MFLLLITIKYYLKTASQLVLELNQFWFLIIKKNLFKTAFIHLSM